MQKKMECFVNKAFGLLGLVIALVGCSDNPPSIEQIFWQVNLRQKEKSGHIEELSFFVHYNDEDGKEDLESLYLSFDKDGFFWKLDPDNWEERTLRSENWIGHSSLRRGDNGTIPRGSVKAMLLDSGGSRDDMEIVINTKKSFGSEVPFAQVSIHDESIKIHGGESAFIIWFYNEAGEKVEMKKVSHGLHPIPTLSGRKVDYFEVYSYWQTEGVGLIQGPYYP